MMTQKKLTDLLDETLQKHMANSESPLYKELYKAAEEDGVSILELFQSFNTTGRMFACKFDSGGCLIWKLGKSIIGRM